MKNRTMSFPLSRKIALMLLTMAIILSAVLIILSYTHYRSEMFEHYEEFAWNIGSVAASQLDPDQIAGYLEAGEPDADYERRFAILSDIRDNGGIMYLYVVKPEVDEVWYVMDTDPTDEAIPLGYHEPYYAGDFADNAERMVRGERIEPLISDEEYGWLMSVYVPLTTSGGEPAGYVGVDILMNDVMDDLHSFAMRSILLMAVLTVGLSLVFIRVTSRSIAQPIRKLSYAAEKLVEEEQTGETMDTSIFSELSIRSKDEIGILYQSLKQMEADINAYIRDLVNVTSEKERIGAELSIATQIQADMLPRIFPAFPERDEFDLFASMTPAKEVGGDFYDFFLIDDDHLGLVMADVSGKGVPAALFMVIAKTLIKNRAQLGESPAEILKHVNEQLCQGNEAELFVTVWLAVIEISTGKGMAANAGHEHPVIRRAGGQYELVVYRHSPAVAAMEGIRFREHPFELHPGDSLFVYTDGVTEAKNAKKELFGTERMLAGLNREADAAPRVLLANVHEEINAFVGDAPQFDDITMMGLTYFGQKKEKELTVEAVDKNLTTVRDFVGAELDALGCPPKTQMQIKVAVEEIFINISRYAYSPQTGHATIQVETAQEPKSVSITFLDRGMPFDPLQKPDPDVTLSAEDRQIGGLGIYMVKKSMDEVRYKNIDGQNILTLVKYF